jgi:hypothetical protein
MRGGRTQGTYAYKSIALPAVGETIFVQKVGADHQGDERILTAVPPVPAYVTRVRAGTITATASEIDSAAAA